MLGVLSKFAPHPEAETFLKNLNTDKEGYSATVHDGCLKLGEVLQLAAGNNIALRPTPDNTTTWAIPFDIIVSSIPRLQPRFYSISSSPKLHPNSIHVTAVVLKYESLANQLTGPRFVYGVATNFLLNIKYAANGETAPLIAEPANSEPAHASPPRYAIEGPRGAHIEENIYKVPVHVRRSTFRLPANPKIPVIMVGPGTVSIIPRISPFSYTNGHRSAGCRSIPWLRPRAGRSCKTVGRQKRTRRTRRVGRDHSLLRVPQVD